MAKLMSREIRLASRPSGLPTAVNFTLASTEVASLRDQEVLVRNLFMSVDPYMRGRMNDGQSYVPPFELGKPLDGGAGKLRNKETVVAGIGRAADAFIGLFDGNNVGKMVVKLT